MSNSLVFYYINFSTFDYHFAQFGKNFFHRELTQLLALTFLFLCFL